MHFYTFLGGSTPQSYVFWTAIGVGIVVLITNLAPTARYVTGDDCFIFEHPKVIDPVISPFPCANSTTFPCAKKADPAFPEPLLKNVQVSDKLLYYYEAGKTDGDFDSVVYSIHGLERIPNLICQRLASLAVKDYPKTLFVCPWFNCNNITEKFCQYEGPNQFNWNTTGGYFTGTSQSNITAFELLNVLIKKYHDISEKATKTLYGFSAGSQFVLRHAMFSTEYPELRYAIASPGTYVYPTAERLKSSILAAFSDNDALSGKVVFNNKSFTSTPSEISKCCNSTYHSDRFGLGTISEQIPFQTFIKGQSAEKLRDNFFSKNMKFLIGGNDTRVNPDEIECPEYVQGKNRLQRAYIFHQYYTSTLAGIGKTKVRELKVAKKCAHDQFCVLNTTDLNAGDVDRTTATMDWIMQF